MSIILKGIDLPTDRKPYGIEVIYRFEGADGLFSEKNYLSPNQAVQIPKDHGALVEEHYPGELKVKQPDGLFIMYRSADGDTDRFIFEAEAEQ